MYIYIYIYMYTWLKNKEWLKCLGLARNTERQRCSSIVSLPSKDDRILRDHFYDVLPSNSHVTLMTIEIVDLPMKKGDFR